MFDPIQRPDFVESLRRVRAEFCGEIIAQSDATILVRGDRGILVYYFPREHANLEHLQPSGQVVTMEANEGGKGDATFWHVGVGENLAENAAWTFNDTSGKAAVIKAYVAFDWSQKYRWFEEGEEVFVHARDPYHRVDVVESQRSVWVVVRGKVLATTTRSRVLFEAGLPVRFYIPPDDVMMEVMEPSNTVTQCPYKGTAEYFSARIDGDPVGDIVWTYPDLIAECPRIAGYISFFIERVDGVFIDGKAINNVPSLWSQSAD